MPLLAKVAFEGDGLVGNTTVSVGLAAETAQAVMQSIAAD